MTRKPISFLPNRMEFSIERNSNDKFTLEYSEYYDYLPKKVREDAINALKKVLPTIGIKETTKLEKGLKMKFSGTYFQILTIMFPELLSRTNQTEINKLTILLTQIQPFMHNNIEFKSEWNKEIEKELNKRIKNPLAV